MHDTLSKLISLINNRKLINSEIIEWGSPIPVFGEVKRSTIATLGLNPSNREFMTSDGTELTGRLRRFHSLKSLEIDRWTDITDLHLEEIWKKCTGYFQDNPYDGWFKSLDILISGTNSSYYSPLFPACHLDLVPYATHRKWANLSAGQKSALLQVSGSALGEILRDSPIKTLVLNGRTVVETLIRISDAACEVTSVPQWSLPRSNGKMVAGVAYRGSINCVSGIELGRSIEILGFNHNIQSSFGVTTQVRKLIQEWITLCIQEQKN
ncbi:hypothetical protein SAMN03159355_04532 [Pseudomonas sp. NFPP10]|uniref:hypothetical protein n=1 Tax=unclassified Pseudomonas TaxID=196821 RepID=UPI00088D7D90|nr:MULTISPECIES: hypothetical protein [unclassified Pseudomonas]SDA32827.1 hypothetical protein SAMN03159465_05556 [Pseudomonas sp. NFPP12]SEM27858.1 hypothetical protein SAMN03159355_04532 [Pseudomonas sp. NFPP10]SFK08480.1 hypothetical protein SAMN03159416_04948 [Pseudomonas sp. NFPP08]SFN26439.1 hypothetical protein SAMN03159476_04579 [Pseudomonas sp. NFPP05]SFX96327.1 hypothetical protein SAMN03159479_05091 [Pseudomonas sp. NFPP09]